MKTSTPTDVLAGLTAAAPDAVFVSTCGYISRDLQQVGPGPNCFYLVGSMGAALPMGLAIADCAPHTRVVVIDGDGSFLMSLNCLPLVGSQAPPNLVHVVLDNGKHESTGGQRTVPAGRSNARVRHLMRAAGYARVVLARTVTADVVASIHQNGPVGIHIPVADRDNVAPRIATEPRELVSRTRKLLSKIGSES